MQRRLHKAAALLCLCMLAALLRIPLLANDLGIDEIWSLHLASTMHTPLDVFQLHSDNNHYLNTLWLFILGTLQPFWLYRLPSFFAGMLLVGMVSAAGWKKHPVTGVILGLITAVSPALTFFSTEARGYLPMLLFACLSFLQMQNLLQKRTLQSALLFSLCAIIAFLWQLMFIHLYLALLVWSGLLLWKKETDRWFFIAAHLPIVFLLALLGTVDFSHLVIGGGPLSTPLQFATGSMQLLFGTPLYGIIPLLTGIIFLFSIVWCIEKLLQQDRAKGVAAIVLFLGSPLLWMLFFHPTILYPRYILVSLLFALLLIGSRVAEGIRQKSRALSSVSLLLLSLYLASATLFYPTLFIHRHDYTTALHIIQSDAGSQTATIGSTVDFRTSLLLWLYTQRSAHLQNVVYLDHIARKTRTPRYWIIDTDIEPTRQSFFFENHRYQPLVAATEPPQQWVVLKIR